MSKLKDSSAIKLFGQTIPLLTTFNQKEASSIADCCDANLLSSSDDHGAQVLESIAKEFVVNDEHDVDNTETEKNSSLKTSKNEETSDQKTLKKPDKILPCPRCNSNETKFCYYNNYNVNQPRHFCKNCQRYWTAGGTMRNLPVGAGRRKTKSSMTISSALHHYHQIMISEAIGEAQASSANLLTFGSSDFSSKQGNNNNNVEDNYNSGESVINVALNKTEDDSDKIHQWLPKWIPQGFPVAYFNSTVVQSSWGVPLMASAAASTSPNSPTPRKHSRDDHQNIDHLVKSKTMRIDDPGETAKSIMLATLVTKTKNNSSSTTNISSGGGMFDGFQSKFNCNERSYRVESFPSAAAVLQANPAAMSRYLNFRENT